MSKDENKFIYWLFREGYELHPTDECFYIKEDLLLGSGKFFYTIDELRKKFLEVRGCQDSVVPCDAPVD